MGFGFLKRKKKEVVDLEDAEQILSEKIDTLRTEFEYFLSEKYPELRSLIRGLLNEMEALNSDGIHPRLRNQARNFTSAMINLWGDLPEMDRESIFDETAKRLEKVAAMRLKQFRFLFGVYPPEIEQIDSILKTIAAVVQEVESKRKELGLDRLSEIIKLIEKLKELVLEKEMLEKRYDELSSNIEEVKHSESKNKTELEEDKILQDLRRKEEELKIQIAEKEAEMHRKIAYARKPIKMYAHMTGRRVNLDTHHFLSNLDEISQLASGAVSEIIKGSIRLKEKNLERITDSLNDIATGKLKAEFEELKKLKNELSATRNKIKVRQKPDSRQEEITLREIEKKLEMCNDRRKEVEKEIYRIKTEIEAKLSELTGNIAKLNLRM